MFKKFLCAAIITMVATPAGNPFLNPLFPVQNGSAAGLTAAQLDLLCLAYA